MTDLVHLPQPPPLPAVHRPAGQNACTVFLAKFKNADTERTMKICLTRIARILMRDDHARPEDIPWERLRYAETNAIRAELARQTNDNSDPWSPATINKHLSALRGVLKTARRMGLMNADDCANATDFENDKGTRLPPGRSIAATEQAAMLAVCDDTLIGIRNAAIVAVLCATGARRAEISGARREHYDPGTRSLKIIGKRDKQRKVHINEDAATYLGDWLSRVDAATGPLFCPVDRWGKIRPRPLSARSIGDVIDGVRRDAKLPKLTPHDFRRTFIGDLLDKGVDVVTIQEIVGHSSPATTARYDRRPEEARRAAADLLSLPRREQLRARP